MSDTYYTVSFQPAGAGAGSPDILCYKGVSNIRITLNGSPLSIHQRGGFCARKRRNENRQERIEKKPIGQEEEDVKEEEDEKDIDNEEQKHRKKLEELRNKNKNRKAIDLTVHLIVLAM